MTKWIVFFALIGCAFAAPNVRIVNGTDAKEGEFPFAVSLRYNLRHTCGATILNERHLLTAAHCVCNNSRPLDTRPYTIQFGSSNISQTTERSVQVSKITCNDFDLETIVNDVAILQLETAIPDSGIWAPVKLARNFTTNVQRKGIAIGWGRLWELGPFPTTLQKLNVDIYPDSICANELFDIKQNICFGASLGGACNGDSGTALLSEDNEQVAVSSFITTGCGIANQYTPNVYARIQTFLEWIEAESRL